MAELATSDDHISEKESVTIPVLDSAKFDGLNP
jgi:hypothetical protein